MRKNYCKHKWRKLITHGVKSPYKIYCKYCKEMKKKDTDKYLYKANVRKPMKPKSIPIILIGIVLFIFLSLSIVSAEQQTLGTFKQYDCINLIQTCGTCTYNNITSVVSPTSTVLLLPTAMTKSGTEYTYSFCNTSASGTYIVNGVGDLDGTATVWAYDFMINPTGRTSNSVFNNPIILILGLVGLILIIFGTVKGIPWFGFIGSVMFLMIGVYVMIYGFDNYTDMYTQSAAIVFLGIGLMFMFSSAYEWLDGGENNGGED